MKRAPRGPSYHAACRSDGETGTATAGRRGVGVGHGETGTFQAFGVIHAAADQVLQAHGIDHHGDAALLDHGIAIIDFLVKRETVLETGAAPPVM